MIIDIYAPFHDRASLFSVHQKAVDHRDKYVGGIRDDHHSRLSQARFEVVEMKNFVVGCQANQNRRPIILTGTSMRTLMNNS